MNLKKMALAAAIACVSYTGSALAVEQGPIQLVSGCADSSCAAAPCGCGQPACGCESVGSCAGLGLGCLGGNGCDGACGESCDGGCGGCDSGCDSGCASCLSDCDLGDAWTLFGENCGWSAGGWLQLGYHTKANGLFNTRPDELQLQQGWLFAEKAIDTSNGFSMGGRIDYLYGTDGQNTQAFGKDDGHWDNDWDNGGDYGHAIPQLYGEFGYGDMSVKVGHFYTIIGWEVVQATGNFFYSHAYTFNNSEPFTHTGALATYNASDDVTIWGGYTTGWDSGFKDNGDAFLGGMSLGLTDKLTLIYASTIGTFGDDIDGGNTGTREQGYMHSIVADVALTDSLQYVFQSDLLDTENSTAAGVTTAGRETFGINQYLIKSINDCTSVGARFEWWNTEAGGTGDSDVYALTLGVNHRPHANVIVRPEVRWDWDDDEIAGLEDGDEQTTFGVDTIFTF